MLKCFVLFLILSVPVCSFAQLEKFENESEVTSIKTGGNTNVQTYSLKSTSKLIYDKYIFTFSGHYFLSLFRTVDNNGDTVDQESARNWDFSAKGERDLNKRLNVFTGIRYEGNEFSGFTQRDNYDIGGKYKIINTDKEKFFTELGYRYSVERLTEPNSDGDDILFDNKGRLYIEYKKTVNEALSYTLWVEYLPNFSRPEDYLVNFEPSLSVLLTSIFSLKVSLVGNYDNRPGIEGNKNLDYTNATTLIARF